MAKTSIKKKLEPMTDGTIEEIFLIYRKNIKSYMGKIIESFPNKKGWEFSIVKPNYSLAMSSARRICDSYEGLKFQGDNKSEPPTVTIFRA